MIFELEMPRGKTLRAMIREARFEDWNRIINRNNFPIQQERCRNKASEKIFIELLSFGRPVNMYEVIEEAKTKNLKPSTLMDILVFGKQFPEEQIHRPIAALGSIWQEYSHRGGPIQRYFPYLYSYERKKKRGLDLFWLDADLDENWSFACTRC